MKTQELVNYILRTGQKGYKDMDDGLRISDEMTRLVEEHINQEVEKRIAEILPTKNEIGNACQVFDKQKRPLWKEAIWRAGANWAVDIIRSRLTQKTEGGGE